MKLKTLKDRNNFMTHTQARAKIRGQLHRIKQSVTKTKDIEIAVNKYYVIARVLHYSHHTFKEALMRFFIITDKPIWRKLHNTI